ncbi:MAG: hypothetical protein Kow0027_17930 [Saprospiraceae bacterium]
MENFIYAIVSFLLLILGIVCMESAPILAMIIFGILLLSLFLKARL